jgi:hypothetical protein
MKFFCLINLNCGIEKKESPDCMLADDDVRFVLS